jgi:hypothetical protein
VTGGVGISGGGVASGSGECGSGSASQESCQIVPPGPITEACIAEGIVDTSCYIPKSQEEIHRVIEHLLQMPTKLKDDNQKVVQLITYSQERDVDPFKDTLDKLYGKNRQPNYGLFAMPEAWDHIHISY